MMDTDDTRRTTDDRQRTTPGVWHKLPTGGNAKTTQGQAETNLALICPTGATSIHSFMRMASFTKMQFSDLYAMRSGHFRRGKHLGTAVPQDENLPTCAQSGLEPLTYHCAPTRCNNRDMIQFITLYLFHMHFENICPKDSTKDL